MNKQEYLDTLIKRDFITFVVLRKPLLTSDEVSLKLKQEIDINRLYRKMKDAIRPVCDRYLSLSLLTDNEGKIVNELPEWLSPSLVRTIADEFSNIIAGEYSASNFITPIIDRVERLVWLQGIDDMADNLRRFLADVKKMAEDYAAIPANTPDEYDLQQKYEAARRITLREHLLNNNSEDIIVFRSALLEYVTNICETIIYRTLAKLYEDIAGNHELNGLIGRLENIYREAEAERETLVIAERNAEWDKEYAHLVPVDFFRHNIGEIDDAMAFHMVLLQAIARNEKQMTDNGVIDCGGNLRMFTGRAVIKPILDCVLND